MHEIVTIQIGEQANYLCTHFWNTQESYFTFNALEESRVNHDIHFRPGIGADGSDTFTPRTLLYDFKQSFGTLRKYNELYDVTEENEYNDTAWSANPTVPQRQPPIQPSQYQRHLNEGTTPPPLRAQDVRYWSDYSRVFYHPNSIMQLYDSDLSPERKAFEGWHDGEELFQALDREKDVFDEQLRPFAEECDQMQGFQIVTSVDDGWGGFAGKCMERVRDEFGKSPVWLWGLNAPKAGSRIEQDRRAANEARSLTELAGQASLYLPLRYVPTRLPSYIALDHSSRWSVSALQQMAFESLLLPTRLKPLGVHDTSNMEELLLACNSDDNKRIAEVKLDIGGMSEMNGSHDAEPHTTGIGKGCDFFPYASGRSRSEDEPHVFSELSTSRGAYVDEQADTSMEETRISRFHTDLAFPIIDSFPPIFPNKPRSVNKLPAKASVSKSSRIAGWSKSLEASVRRRVGVDEREPILDGLRSTSDAYAAGGEDRAAGDEDWDD